ncbi:MAG: RNA polymerase sigma factor SigC [Trichodesmium sp. St16_bin4-tuft]|nr:RNA polymerase sigma factor SigC [Trichodesmium sp. St4_bin8_1]MDE5072059.1 RNA polymerase sigma factor SigC [Trichodesmium sp. St5_bin8]MDE5076861.1 RNA polymerase sigma factor SigC [Trichodesmium sp. St2_bin6]MDE5090480.1 RNA polymerase sigma factor SigC [Trichodesmium sp. St18_bin3_1_1]MDE5097871.1 RNA polymerase sigma factor SigC [Trichodesmium sp. St16_bin4-tuft]MDE5105286.1 RNA polymerase sigma factor SigC [Trichodesmium sp. St19_bin2]
MITTSEIYPYTEDTLQSNNLQDEYSEHLGQTINELTIEDKKVDNSQINTNHSGRDLVRLYLQEIGRVDLLQRDQEVSTAQKVQRYVHLLELRNKAAEQGQEIQRYLEMIEIRDRLAARLGHKPSFERWLKAGNLSMVELKEIIAVGKLRWAKLAGLNVKELEQIQTEGIEARNQMMSTNLRLVVSIAKKYQNRGLELLDLIQEGTLGLERAVEKFDPQRGYRFSTYAYWWIRQGITRAIATQSRTIRLPIHVSEKLNKIKKVQQKIFQEKGYTAKVEEIARELKITAAQVREVLVKIPHSVSLETKVGRDRDTELGELLETKDASPEEMLIRESLAQALKELLLNLTQRERYVIRMRYGLEDGRACSLSEIASALKLSRERVRQIEVKALHKLRQPKCRNQIQDYLESLN